MRGFWQLALVQTKLFLREPPAFFFTLVFPALLLLIFGSIFGNEPHPDFNPDFGYVDHEVPGFACIIIASVALMGIPIETASSREQGVLRRYRATPIHAANYFSATILIYFAMSVLGMIVLIVTGLMLYNLRFQGDWWNLLAGFGISCGGFFSLGYLVASISPTARIAQVLGQILFFPLMFLSGATIPFEIMPEGVRRFADFLPLTHAVKLLQGLWFGEQWGEHLGSLSVLVVMFVVGSVLSARFFRWE